MGSPSNMRSVVNRNVVMRRITVHHCATLPSRRIVYAALSCDSTWVPHSGVYARTQRIL